MPVESLPTGIELYFESHGQGEPLILIPGTGFSGDVWLAHQVPVLSKSLKVILHDPRGCGRSTPSKGVYTIDQLANDVVALLDHLGIGSAHVLGHSMGGRIGLSMALNFPSRVKSRQSSQDAIKRRIKRVLCIFVFLEPSRPFQSTSGATQNMSF